MLNKTRLLLATFLIAFAVAICTSSARAQTEIDVTLDETRADFGLAWDGSGFVSISVFSGDDAESYFDTAGSHIWGEFHATDCNDNPYGYGVDTFETSVEAEVGGGGFIEFGTVRTDSWERMYGDAGQGSYTFIETSDWGRVHFRTNTNYARLRDCEYGYASSNNFEASGDDFFVVHDLWDSDGDGAYVLCEGDGSVSIDLMNSESWGSSFKFGTGCGCYTNCDAVGTGEGWFEVDAMAENYLEGDMGFELPSGGEMTFTLEYEDGFTVANFAVEGN